MDKERRRRARFRTEAHCAIRIDGARGEPLPGTLRDMSTASAMVETDSELATDQKVAVSFEDYPDPVPMTVVNCRQVDGGRYAHGLKLQSSSWPYRLFVRLSDLLPETHGERPECLEILGLEAGCTIAEVRRAYYRRVRTAHPDAGGTVAQFSRLRGAYDDALLLTGGHR